METNTWEFDCGLSGFLNFLMFEFSCQNKIANISAMVKASRKCEYALELSLNSKYLIIGHEKLHVWALNGKNCLLAIAVFKVYAKSYRRTCLIVSKF